MKIKRYLIKITKNYEAIITGMTAWMKRQRWLGIFTGKQRTACSNLLDLQMNYPPA
jgi:hypothetical protein